MATAFSNLFLSSGVRCLVLTRMSAWTLHAMKMPSAPTQLVATLVNAMLVW
jgi:hypothetical protein